MTSDLDIDAELRLFESFIYKNRSDRIAHEALARLSANERWVLGLAYFRDCTQTEIAALTGLPLGTVKSLVTRAQHKLRETLTAVAAP